MRRIALAIATALTASSFAATAQAAPPPDPWGTTCGVAAATDPDVQGRVTGEVVAGPLFVGDGVPAEVTCTIQTSATHGDTDVAVVSGEGAGVVSARGSVSFAVDRDDDVWLCTQVHRPGWDTLYLDDVTGRWTTHATAGCGLLRSIEPSDGVVGDVVRLVISLWDDPFIICAITVSVDPPEGDINGIWDCPPYGGQRPWWAVAGAPRFVAPQS